MRIAELRASLTQAIDQQQVIMEVFKGKKTPVIVPGAAGTGKTHLAIAEAKRAHQRGDRTLFICFNKVLAQHLKSELAGFSFVEVHNIHSYMMQVSDQTAPDLHDESWWRTVLPHLAQEAILEKGPLDRFDCLIVDEAQDICLESYLDVLDLSLEKGIANSPSFFFGDFEHQAIYMNGPVALEKLREKARGAFESTALDVNCRNTKEIGDTVMQILGLPNMYSGYRRKDSGVKPSLIRVEDGVVPDNYVKSELARLAKTFPLEDIVLLSSNRKLLQDLVATLKFETVSIDNPKKGRLRWGTAQAFKGMEAAAVILVEFEDGASSRDTFYIGSTRSLAELACIMPAKTIDKLVRGN
jgi:DNA helicase IV